MSKLPTMVGTDTMTDADVLSAARRPRPTPIYLGKGTLVGRYVIQSVVERGGMGVVYEAEDRELERRIALKLLLDEGQWGVGEIGRARLFREAQAMARLEHPNVVRVYDVGTHADKVFLAMEFIDGRTLRAWARAEKRDWRVVLELFIQAGRGLATAHRAGLIHRDFKPDNVMLTRSMQAKVMDFGLARATEYGGLGEHERSQVTLDGPVDQTLELSASQSHPPFDKAEPRYLLWRALQATGAPASELAKVERDAVALFETAGARGAERIAQMQGETLH